MTDLVLEEIRWQARLCRLPTAFAKAKAEFVATFGAAMIEADEQFNQANALLYAEVKEHPLQ